MKTKRAVLVALLAAVLPAVEGAAIADLGGATVVFSGATSPFNFVGPLEAKSGQLTGSAPNIFNWEMNYDVDPFLSWTFTSLLPGTYTIVFSIPVAGGPYDFVSHSAGGSITGIPTTTSVTDYTVGVEIPAGSSFLGSAFDLALSDTTATFPSTVGIAPASAFGGVPAISPASMALVVKFTQTGVGVVNLNGGLVLTGTPSVPEPAMSAVTALLMASLGGLAFWRRRVI